MVLVASMAAFAFVLSSFITDLVLGFLIAAMSRPLYVWLHPRFRQRDWLAALVVTALVAVAVSVPLGVLVTSLSRQAASAYGAIRESLGMGQVQQALEPEGWLGRQLTPLYALAGVEYSVSSIEGALSETAGSIAGFLTSQLNALVSNVLSALYHFAMMLVVVFYSLIDGPRLKRRIFDLSPLPDHEEEMIVGKFRDVGVAVLVGNGVGSALQGLLGGAAMAVADLPSPVFWGFVMTIFAFLPLVGISVVVLPATLYLFLVERYLAAVLFFGFCTLQGVVIENVLKTKLMGDRMHMHSLIIFLALLGGISSYGIVGLLYGPLIATFFLTVLDLYERVYRDRLFPTPGAAQGR